MIRFFAFVWDPSIPAQSAHAQMLRARLLEKDPAWSVAFDRAGMAVLASGTAPGQLTRLPAEAGLIVGSIFPHTDPVPAPQESGCLDAHEGAAVIRSEGEHLIRTRWGAYVAFLRPGSGKPLVLAAPFGWLPCYSTSLLGVHLFFSRTEDLLSLGLPSVAVNWDCFLAHVVHQHVYCTETALEGISQVLPGERVRIEGAHLSRTLLWNPLRLPPRDLDEGPGLARQVHDLLKSATHALAGPHRRIVHLLSGGLDSSIVLACLTDAPGTPVITCLNQHSPGITGDERCFARLAAQDRPCTLVEMERDPAIRFEAMLEGVRTANPVHHLHDLIVARPAEHLARELGATAIFTGTFGDALFYRRPARVAAAEYLWRRGVNRELLRVALWAALVDRTSLWQILGYALRQRLRGRSLSHGSVQEDARREQPEGTLISAEARAAVANSPRLLHPWFHNLEGVSPGTLWQAFLVEVVIGDNPFAQPDSPDMIHPMMNHPLAEICLGTPVYLHFQGGVDRALARRAFAAELPAALIQRMTKGTAIEYVHTLIVRNLPFIREMLLEGRLVRERVLDRQQLERLLRGEPRHGGGTLKDLTGLLSKEIWLQQWASGTRAA